MRTSNCPRRRRYIYAHQLEFLLPSLQDKKNYDQEIGLPKPDSQQQNSSQCPVPSKKPCLAERPRRCQSSTPNSSCTLTDTSAVQRSRIRFSKEYNFEEVDEDKTFLHSLLPSFRRMTDDEKLEAKIEFLSTIRRICNRQKSSNSNLSMQNNARESEIYFDDTSNIISNDYNIDSSEQIDISPQESFKISKVSPPSSPVISEGSLSWTETDNDLLT